MSTRMSNGHLLLALALAAIWGVNFVVIKVGLDDLPPLLFSSLRFLAAAVPAILILRSPGAPWRWVLIVALTLCVLQFGLLFSGMAAGMPPGLSSLVVQMQAPFTALLAMALLGERLGKMQSAGLIAALGGVALIGVDLGATSPIGAFLLVLGAAAGWAASNVAMRKAKPPDMLRFMIWASALSVLPLLALSIVVEGPQRDLDALAGISWAGIGAILFVGPIATVFGFGVWGYLIRTYSASTVAPFSLLVPVFGVASAALLVGERISPLQLIAGVVIVSGVLAGALSRPASPATLEPERKQHIAA